jgi:hypothetical protein
MQTPKHRTRHHSQVLWNPVPVRLQWHGQIRGRLPKAWPQGHMRAACVVMLYPLVRDAAGGVFYDHKDVEDTKGRRDHDPEITGHHCRGMLANNRRRALG